MSERQELAAARERAFELQLEEAVGGSRPTSRRDEILARLEAVSGEATPHDADRLSRVGVVLAAAMLLLAVAVVFTIALLDRNRHDQADPQRHEAGRDPTAQDPADQDPRSAPRPTKPDRPVMMRSPAELATADPASVQIMIFGMTAEACLELVRFRDLRELHLTFEGAVLGPAEGRALAKLAKLESLSLTQAQVDRGFFAELEALPLLSGLALYCAYEEGVWKELARLPGLTRLGLNEPQLDASAAADLATALPHLTALAITSDVMMAQPDFAPLAGLTALRRLNLGHSTNVDNATIAQLVGGKSIQALDLAGPNQLDAGVVDVLLGLRDTLTELELSEVPLATPDLTRIVAGLPHLESFTLTRRDEPFDRAFAEALASCPKLRNLDLGRSKGLTLQDLQLWTALPLENANFQGFEIEDSAVEKLFPERPAMLRLPSGRLRKPR